MPSVPLDVPDALELAELLEFLSDWLESDHDNLTASLARFVGSPGYGPDTLRGDFSRFLFLLGFTDGECFFTPDQPCPVMHRGISRPVRRGGGHRRSRG